MSILPGLTPPVPQHPPLPRCPSSLIQLCALQGYHIGGFPADLKIPFKPLPKKKALLIGINYGFSEPGPFKNLNGPQKDVEEMYDLLTCLYGYKKEDVVILSDKVGVADNLTPTYSNIMRKLDAFLKDQNPGDHYTFLFAGHASQKKGRNTAERDERDEQIITSDREVILDDLLNKYLVKHLKNGSHLTAIFDSCHSGTLLDLPHDKCNRVYNLTSSTRRSVRRILEPVLKEIANLDDDNSSMFHEMHEFIINSFFPGGFCSGYCPRHDEPPPGPTVVCISACKDNQYAFETEEGKSITQLIIDNLRKNPNPTLKELMRAITSDSQILDDHIKQDQDDFKKRVEEYKKTGKLIVDPDQPMLEYKRDPQLSSLWPLRMNSVFNM